MPAAKTPEREMASPDILIVGAGVAGLSLATALGREGFHVTVIDGASRPQLPATDRAIADWDLRVSALTPLSIAFLEGLGAWSAIPANRTGCYTGMKVWDGHGSGRIRFDASEVNAPYLGHIVENRLTLQALLQCAETCPGVDVRWECAMDTMTHTHSGWEICCQDGSTFCASLTVGADGARSRVREWAAMPTRQWSYDQNAIVGTVALASHHQDACWQAFLIAAPSLCCRWLTKTKWLSSGRWMNCSTGKLLRYQTRHFCRRSTERWGVTRPRPWPWAREPASHSDSLMPLTMWIRVWCWWQMQHTASTRSLARVSIWV